MYLIMLMNHDVYSISITRYLSIKEEGITFEDGVHLRSQLGQKGEGMMKMEKVAPKQLVILE